MELIKYMLFRTTNLVYSNYVVIDGESLGEQLPCQLLYDKHYTCCKNYRNHRSGHQSLRRCAPLLTRAAQFLSI